MQKNSVSSFQEKVSLFKGTVEPDQSGGLTEKWEKIGEYWVLLIPKQFFTGENMSAVYQCIFRGNLVGEGSSIPRLKIVGKDRIFRTVSYPLYSRKFHTTTFIMRSVS